MRCQQGWDRAERKNIDETQGSVKQRTHFTWCWNDQIYLRIQMKFRYFRRWHDHRRHHHYACSPHTIKFDVRLYETATKSANRTGIASFEYFSNLCPHALSLKVACVRVFFSSSSLRLFCFFASLLCYVAIGFQSLVAVYFIHSFVIFHSYYHAIMGTHYLTMYAYCTTIPLYTVSLRGREMVKKKLSKEVPYTHAHTITNFQNICRLCETCEFSENCERASARVTLK